MKKWKKISLFLATVFAAIALAGCGTTKVESKTDSKLPSTEQDKNGKIVISNETNDDVIVFVNGEARKRIRPTIQSSFRMELTEKDLDKNNKRAFVSVYPVALFKDANFSLTAENKSKSVFVKQIALDGNYEFHIEQDAVAKVLDGHSESKLTQAEFIFRFPSHAKSYLIELYSDMECTKRFVLGSLTPGDELHAFRNPEIESEISIYAKYVRNDGKGTETIAKGKVDTRVVYGDGIPIEIDIPDDPRKLTASSVYGTNGRISEDAVLVIENTRQRDRTTGGIIRVCLDRSGARIENSPDIKNKKRNMSLIEPKTRQSYILNVGKQGKSYKLFIEDISDGKELKCYDINLNGGEKYYITAPGTMPSGIDSPDAEIQEKDTLRKLTIASNQPLTQIFYSIKSKDSSIVVEKSGEILLGTTSDETSGSTLTKTLTLPVNGLTYNNAAAVKIVLTAKKEGFAPQTKSINAQTFLDSVRGISLPEQFSLESIEF